MLRLVLIALLALPFTPAMAQGLLSAEDFDRLSRGKTLSYTYTNGRPAGRERHFANRIVKLQSANGTCRDGHWFEENGAICFTYDGWAERGEPEKHCWLIVPLNDGLVARPSQSSNPFNSLSVAITNEPLECLAPNLGV